MDQSVSCACLARPVSAKSQWGKAKVAGQEPCLALQADFFFLIKRAIEGGGGRGGRDREEGAGELC